MMKRGFTLVETIIYLFILALLAVVVVSLLLNMSKSFYRFQINRRLTHSAELTLGRLERELRQARSVNLATSILGGHPGKLVLNTGPEASPTTIEFALVGDALMVREGGGVYASTTDGAVAVTELIFRSVGTSGSQAVRIEFSLRDKGLLATEANFYDTVVLRGSY